MSDGPGPGTIQTTALIVAAGSGLRLGAGGPKALVEVGGRPLFEWALDACRESSRIGRIVIAVPPGHGREFAVDPERDEVLVDGGAARSQSVAAGLEAVETEFVLVHDAARPLVTADLIDRTIFALEVEPDVDAVISAAPVTDTVKVIDHEGVVASTLDRDTLRSVQTPQVFRTEALRRAIELGDVEQATDDAFLIESAGGRVGVFDGPPTNIKVTVPADLAMAEFLLGRDPENS